MRAILAVGSLLLVALSLSGCVDNDSDNEAGTLTILTYDAFSVDKTVIDNFTAATGVKVRFLMAEDAGGALNVALLNQDNPIADLLLGLDNTFLQIALDGDLLEPYESPGLASLTPGLVSDAARGYVTPYDHGYIALNYNDAWFEGHNYTVPASLEELAEPRYKGVVAVQNPYTSSPGRGFLFATVDYFRNDNDPDYDFDDWWSDMAANDLIITPGWTEAYLMRYEGGYGKWEPDFVGGAQLVVSYTTSPGIEAFYDNPDTRALVIDRASFHQIEYAGVLKGAGNPGAARQFIDFMLQEEFQAQLPYNQVMFPVVKDFETDLPQVYRDHAPVPQHPAELTDQELATRSEEWLQAWLEAV